MAHHSKKNYYSCGKSLPEPAPARKPTKAEPSVAQVNFLIKILCPNSSICGKNGLTVKEIGERIRKHYGDCVNSNLGMIKHVLDFGVKKGVFRKFKVHDDDDCYDKCGKCEFRYLTNIWMRLADPVNSKYLDGCDACQTAAGSGGPPSYPSGGLPGGAISCKCDLPPDPCYGLCICGKSSDLVSGICHRHDCIDSVPLLADVETYDGVVQRISVLGVKHPLTIEQDEFGCVVIGLKEHH